MPKIKIAFFTTPIIERVPLMSSVATKRGYTLFYFLRGKINYAGTKLSKETHSENKKDLTRLYNYENRSKLSTRYARSYNSL